MATINGIPVNFGFTGTNGITITGITGALLQSAEQTSEAELEVTRNGVGDRVVHGHYDLHDSATLEYVVTGAATLADAIANSVVPAVGGFITITACASMPGLITNKWEVQRGGKLHKSNTSSAKVTLPILRCANIQATIT